NKALPLAPPELASTDRITTLEAQQNGLRLRRANIERVLRDLDTPLPSNPLLVDIKTRWERERKLKIAQEELESVKVAEHDVGLKLLRAYKKREREAEWESSSTLWVRRVTS
ncbi:hypothetical protein K402DRAFT_307532, partial [Aulographum hederae CBS 113979]